MTYFSLLKKSSSKLYNLRFLKAQLIKSSLIFVLRPEWLAKIERCNKTSENNQYSSTISQHLKKIDKKSFKNQTKYKVHIECFFNYKNNQNVTLIKRINNNKTVSNIIRIWVNNQHLVYEELEHHKSMIFTNRFNELITTIYLTGLEWYMYTNLKIEQLYKKLYISNHNKQALCFSDSSVISSLIRSLSRYSYTRCRNIAKIRCSIYHCFNKYIPLDNVNIEMNELTCYCITPSNKSIKDFSHIIRSNLYHKNSKGIWRINNQLTINNANLLVQFLTYLYNEYYCNKVGILNRRLMQETTNNIFYLWQRKKR